MRFSTRVVQGPAGRLVVTTAGEGGLPVLLVHDHGGTRSQWAEQQAHLEQRSVSFDLRGMGESDPDPAGRYHSTDFAEDVGAVVDALGLERFVLVGHGFGCEVAGAYAAQHPGRVAGLVAVETETGSLPDRTLEKLLSRYPGPRLLVSMTAPESLNDALDEFLTGVEERLDLEDALPPGPTDASGALTMS